METPISPALLTAAEVAKLLAISPRQVWKLKSQNILPEPIRLAGSTRWRKIDLDLLLEKLAAEVSGQ
jgi:predicted DNA-binding transcriptional regulator AlpA